MKDKALYRTGLVFAVLTALGWILFVVGSMGLSSGGVSGIRKTTWHARTHLQCLCTHGEAF